MNKLIIILILSILSAGLKAQNGVNLTIVKPVINFNDSTGGYYSNLFFEQFHGFFAGAIVKNNGTDTATNVYLKVTDLYSSGYTAYSDSIASIAPGETDTIKMFFIPKPNNFQNYGSINPKYEILSDQADIYPSDNISIIPISRMYSGDWSFVGRSNKANNSLKNTNGIQSGDFIGIKISFRDSASDLGCNFYPIGIMQINLTNNNLPDSSFIIGKVYHGDTLIAYSDTITHIVPFGLVYLVNFQNSYPYYNLYLPADSLFAGFEVHFKDSIPDIGTDTAVFHNFGSEAIMRRNGQWSNLNYIPLVSLVFYPEGIEESEKALPIKVYPNPATDFITLKLNNINSLMIYDINGKEVYYLTGKNIDNRINIKNLPSGVYFIKAVTGENIYIGRIIKQP